MKRLCILALPVFAAISSPANAQAVDAALLAKVDALPIERMCSKDGVYQYRFGSTDLPPSLISMPGFDQRPLPESARPFERVALSATKWSNRFYGADFEAHFANQTTALSVIDHLAKRFEALGWTARRRVAGSEMTAEDISLLDPAPAEGDVHLYADAASMKADPPMGVRANFDRLGTAVTFSCDNVALLSIQIHEALGDLPPGTPKPLLPAMPRPVALNPALCATAAGQSQIDGIAGGTPDAATRFVASVMGYHERIVVWKSDRLTKSGKVSAARMADIAMSGLTAGGNLMQGLTSAMKMLDDANRYSSKLAAGDKPGACRAIVTMMGRLATVEAATRPQWHSIEAALDAEAKRIGVSFN
ncbi:hypothetical protein U1839_15600 [Sphingomonas sp. RT2P30]